VNEEDVMYPLVTAELAAAHVQQLLDEAALIRRADEVRRARKRRPGVSPLGRGGRNEVRHAGHVVERSAAQVSQGHGSTVAEVGEAVLHV
jgi:hypothetical protein